jgi:RHS repeat-associated protein
VITNLVSRRGASPVPGATGFGRGIPARVRPQTSQTYYHRNQQYSIVGLTNAAGTLVEGYTYSAYGTLGIYAANGTVLSSSTYANRYTYTGREWDAELRLYHFRARWYDSSTGGFISRDPLGYVDGMSLYRGYFGVRGVDPSGEVYCRCERSRHYTSIREGYTATMRVSHEVRQTDIDCNDLEWTRFTSSSTLETYKCTEIIVKARPPKRSSNDVINDAITLQLYGYITSWKEDPGPWSEWNLVRVERLDKGALCYYKSTRTVALRAEISYTVNGKSYTRSSTETKIRTDNASLVMPICKGQECVNTIPAADYPVPLPD